jgi:hypothetical protein
MSKQKDDEIAQEMMDTLSEKYKQFESKLWDVQNIKVKIINEGCSPYNADYYYIALSYRKLNGDWHEYIKFNHYRFMDKFGFTLNKHMDWRYKRMQRKLVKWNKVIKRELDARLQYNC